jgi:hypothetical protein
MTFWIDPTFASYLPLMTYLTVAALLLISDLAKKG